MADIKDKIAKLLALAESPNEAEAKAALLKARELMAKNKLTPEECKEQKNQKLVKDFTDIQCTAMTNPWAAENIRMTTNSPWVNGRKDRGFVMARSPGGSGQSTRPSWRRANR